jgi:hypothetical protein
VSDHWALLRRRPWLAAVAPIAPLVVLAVRATTWHWHPTGDFAHTELLVRRVPGDPPLVGVAARVGDLGDQGFTPGPSMAYVLAPVYRLLGSTSWALVVSVLVAHAAAIVAAIWLARRVGGRVAAVATGVVLAVMVRASGPAFFGQPWNVWVPVLAFAVLLLVVWAIVLGRPRWWPVAVVVGVHCMQTHVSYVGLVVGLLTLAAAWTLWRWWRDRPAARVEWRWPALGAVAGVVMWIPPIIEQVDVGTGNLRKLYDEFASPDEPTVGWTRGLKALAGELNLLGPWVVGAGKQPDDAPSIVGALAFWTLAIAGAWFAVRRRDRLLLHLYAVLGWAVALGAISASRVFGTFFDYLIRWAWPMAAMITMASAWSVYRASMTWGRAPVAATSGLAPDAAVSHGAPGRARRSQAWMLAAGAVSSVAGAAAMVDGALDGGPYPRDSRTVAGLAEAIEPQLDTDTTYQVERHDPATLSGVAFGMVLELRRHDVAAYAGGWGRAGVGDPNWIADGHADDVLYIVSGETAIAAYRRFDGATELGSYDPRSPGERARSDDLRRQVLAALCDRGGDAEAARLDASDGNFVLLLDEQFTSSVDDGVVDALRKYNELRLPVAAFVVPDRLVPPGGSAVDLSADGLAALHPCGAVG